MKNLELVRGKKFVCGDIRYDIIYDGEYVGEAFYRANAHSLEKPYYFSSDFRIDKCDTYQELIAELSDDLGLREI